MTNSEYLPNENLLDQIAQALQTDGLLVLPDGLPFGLTERLQQRIDIIANEVKPAGVGRGRQHARNENLRTDSIQWLDNQYSAEAAYLAWMEQLRLGLNRRLFLGLFDYEAHFAVYEPGAYYRKHLDAFQGNTNRVLTTVFYLNPDWLPEEGGELLVYSADGSTVINTVMPQFGTMVIFLSEQFPHEVIAAQRRRYSIAGWFRVNELRR
jgi:SM-20-related protein